MRYTQKAKEIDAFQFPIEIEVSRPLIQDSRVHVPAGDYLLIVDGELETMTKKQFQAVHEPAPLGALTDPRVRKPRTVRKVKRGLKGSVLEPQSQPNGAEIQP